ncbi:MAG: transposase [Meiothermus sp.]|uniref:IS701 family transposase n=1 Tax=Meiothermus sp. TaxID=1955249 RepID=UPI0021DE47D3|nr:transposase [Meiothermus sp.]GIW27576.1 MAG: transposase [Meiothermus sp.]
MNPPKCNDLDYIHFLIAAQRVFTCSEAARCQPEAPAHDAFTRLLQRQPPDTEALWQEARALVEPTRGLLVLDDTTLDKPYARRMELVTYHWSGKHQRVVKGIALMTLLWTEGQALISLVHGHSPSREGIVPCDFRVYDKPSGGPSKNAHFLEMLRVAKGRGFAPAYVLMDSWYASLENLKGIAGLGWRFLTRLKGNRLVNPEGAGLRPVSEVEIPPAGRVVHLKGFGLVRVFRTVSKDGDAEYWATNDLGMREDQRGELERAGWGIEVYHRGLKGCCGVERAQVRKKASVLGHLLLALRAFLRLEAYRLRTGVSWYESKTSIIREAIRSYLANPIHILHPTA